MTKLSSEKPTFAEPSELRVVVVEQGPYLLYGSAPMAQQFIMPDTMGESWYYKQGREFSVGTDGDHPTSLCRCGASHNKPFCDGSHEVIEWSGELTASMDKILDEARIFEDEGMVLGDNEKYCCYARFCHPGGSVWRLAKGSADPEARDLAIREASMCPSARLMAWDLGEESPFEFDFEPSIGLIEDPAIGCSGGIWLRGGIAVERGDSERYEVRNRVVLCRCGQSRNKPYCDGAHAAYSWSDGLEYTPEGEELPTGEVVIVRG